MPAALHEGHRRMARSNQGVARDGSGPHRIRQLERQRLRALVEKDLEIAQQLHADDYQLITPSGAVYSKTAYLDAIASGELDYRVWEPVEPGELAVRMYGGVALIRYQARIELSISGQALAPVRLWHTDAYELRGGRWQAVWPQATTILASHEPPSADDVS
jgi:hypothetical protein